MTGVASGESSSTSVTLCAARIAAAYTNGLNVEPGWRMAWVARLYFESVKSRPPISASTYPVRASIATIAPWRYGVKGPRSSPPPPRSDSR
jgi:hypothetical protein